MLEALGIEVGAEPLVHHPQEVPVERRGHPRGVIVRGFQAAHVLHQIEPHQETVARRQLLRHPS